MKKKLLIFIMLLVPQLIFASYDNLIVKTGDFKISLRYHFNDGIESRLNEYESYWELLNLIISNNAKLKLLNVNIDIFLTYSKMDSSVNAYIESGSEYFQNQVNFSSDNIEGLIKSIAEKIQTTFFLGPSLNRSIFFHRIIIPLEQEFCNILDNYDLNDYSNMYIGANDGETFWGVFNLIIFDQQLFDELLNILYPLNYSHYHYSFKKETINALQNTGFLER